MEIGGGRGGSQDGHRLAGKPEAGVQRFRQPERRQRLLDVGVRCHGAGVHAGIGAAGALDRCPFAGHFEDGLLDGALHAWSVRLPLPAHIGAAVIFDGEAEALHQSGWPATRRRPRR